MGIRRLIRNIVRRWLWVAFSILVPVIGSWLALEHWESLRTNWESLGTSGESLGTNGESASATIRNIGLVIAGSTALFLALWRGFVAEDQADAAQQSLRNERYQKGAEMLGSEVLSVRLGGIYALQRLAKEYPKEYHVQIISLFCAFVRHPTVDKGHVNRIIAKMGGPHIREDVQAVMQAIGKRDKHTIKLENKETKFYLDLGHAHLKGGYLADANLAGAHLWKADLSNLDLSRANLSRARLHQACLSNTNLTDAKVLIYVLPRRTARSNSSKVVAPKERTAPGASHRAPRWPFLVVGAHSALRP